jgi:hypothetical protein
MNCVPDDQIKFYNKFEYFSFNFSNLDGNVKTIILWKNGKIIQ